MTATREKQHSERLPLLKDFKLRLLPVAAIYGGNASGKTNLCRALAFARNLVVLGVQPDALIPVDTFLLDPGMADVPSTFVTELFVQGRCYEFGFSVNQHRVIEEWLVEILKTTEKEIYRREGDSIQFAESLDKDKFFHFAFKGTRENQLFLTNAVNQKIELFKPIYDWFRDGMVFIAPDARFGPFEQFLHHNSRLNELMNEALNRLDTGIARLGGEEISFENLPIPADERNKLREIIGDNVTARLILNPLGERYVVWREGGNLKAKKLVAWHRGVDNSEIKFDLRSESDGTLRIIELLPAFLALCMPKMSRLYIIDELDRSLHTILTRKLLETFLSACGPNTRSQLLFTTHDVLLMDQHLFRRDEMWVTERNSDGSTELIALSDYKEIRKDKDIRKSYLQGRLGGIPRILLNGPLFNTERVAEGDNGQ